MSLPEVVSREDWLIARKELLAREKELTRQRDALNADRRRLPMVRVDKSYRFVGPDGEVSLADLFDGRRQLVVQHVMLGPGWADPCPGCSAALDEMGDGVLPHLHSRDTSFVLVSRAPYQEIAAQRASRGWTQPWYSSFGTEFNYDFDVTLDSAVKPPVYNYRPSEGDGEQPGFSCFLRDGDDIFHTYSTYSRGTDHFGGAYGFLDLTALGRQEDWEEPKDRNEKPRPNTPFFTD